MNNDSLRAAMNNDSLRAAMRGLCRDLADGVVGDCEIRLEAWSEAGRAAQAPLSTEHPLVRAISAEQERERVRADVSAIALGELLRDAIEGGLIEGMRGTANAPELAKRVRARVDLVLDGARKRNERVAAPVSAPRGRSAGS